MTRLTRADLINWADTRESQGLLPQLVRRLILVSNRSIESIIMPYGDAIGRSGLDGYVRARTASEYVFAGESVWELSTNKEHVTKANNDYKKRTTATTYARQQELAFCFVTPRHWEKKAHWASDPGPDEPRILGNWKQVRVYDVDDLLGWLSDCRSVEAWFARKLGKATAGIRDVEGYWENVATTDVGCLEPSVLLAGREELSQQVQEYFAEEGKTLKPLAIYGRSPAEVVPFAVASLIKAGNESVLGSTIVVDSRSRWEQLIAEESALRLIVTSQVQPVREELQHASHQGHRVLYCSETGAFKLPRLSEYEVRRALISSGVSEGQATRHAKQCGGNGQLLLDRLSGLDTPAGSVASRLDDRVKVTCLLLVAWDGQHLADREIFSLLSGVQYKDIEASLAADSNDPNGLLFRADGKYRLLSPELAWTRYASLITKSIVDDYADVVRYVLADDDPTAGLSGSKRLTAQFLGNRPEFSGTLRQNIVHSLAIASSLGTSHLNLNASMSTSFVDWIVGSSLGDANFRRWASFRGELSILAEASPDVLLDALERDLRLGGPLHEVMEHSETGLFCSPAQVGILWALERLCWSTDYLERAVGVLIRLTALKSEHQSGNNPANSIRETLQLGFPQTSAEWPIRQRAIKRILEEDTDTAFRLVISLFPTGHRTWMCRDTPTWRDWAYSYVPGTTYGQIHLELRWCVEQLLLVAGDYPDRWCALLGLCGSIDDSQFDHVVDSYESKLEAGVFTDEARRLLWETINAMLVRLQWTASRHRLSNGNVVDETELANQHLESAPHFPQEVHQQARFGKRLRQLLLASSPVDPVLAGCHAFLSGPGDNHCSRHFSDRFNYEKHSELINNSRRLIIGNVWKNEGLVGLQRLAAIPHVDAGAVGKALVRSNWSNEVLLSNVLSLFTSTAESDRLLASGFIQAWSWERKDSLMREVVPLLSSLPGKETKALFLQCLPLVPEVWECVDEQEPNIQQLYWKHALIPWEIPKGRLEYFVLKLIQAARADRAVELLAHQHEVISESAADLVFAALEALPYVVRDARESRHESLRWAIQQLLEILYTIGMQQVERLVKLELLYNTVFDNDPSQFFQPQGLLTAIRDSPVLFVDLLTCAYRDDTGKSSVEEEESMKSLANQVGNLLFRLAELPGQSELCPMIGKSLSQWVAEVMRIATEQKYIRAARDTLARIIACRSWVDISSWPTPEVSQVITFLAEDEPESFQRLLVNNLLNARGVHWVDPKGHSERRQAVEIRNRAVQLQKACPTATSALCEVAKYLEHEAIRNVERAKWERD